MKYEPLDNHDAMVSMDEQSDDPMLPQEPQQHVTKRFRISSTCLILYSAVQTVVVLICLITILVQLRSKFNACPDGGNIRTGFHTKYGRDWKYMTLSHNYDKYWEDLEGSTAVFNLSDPKRNGEELPASISMFHQLHCLTSFRNALQQGREGIDYGKDWRDNPHWPHCFDYLRKTILCWADDTIERQPPFSNGTLAGFIDGSHDTRQCGDSGKLIQIMRNAGKDVGTKPLEPSS